FRSSWDFRCTDSAPMYFKNEDGSFQRRVEGFYHESGICSYNIKYIKFDGYDIYRLPLSDDYEFRIIVPPENVDPNKAFQYQNFNYNLELAARRARSLNSQTNYRFILFVPNLYIQGNFDLSRDFYSNIPMNASQSVAIRVDKYGVQMRAISKSVADLIYVDPSNPYVHTNQLVYPYESLGIQHRNYQLSYFSPHFLTRPFAWHLRDSRQDTILAMGIVRHP
ncbi:MAG: hypothetical protein OXC48_01640, partial [Endozoicomonadaceae bacterium]|nr:hypothetical protein [Endozoicomonadaceae bacterium]